jgi:hypothetical protein
MHCRKRTKKSAPKPRRKKAKTDPTPSGEDTPRTRLALAREATTKAAREVEDAAAKATAAVEVAAAAERQVIPALEIEDAPPSSTARRYALLGNKCLAETYCCQYKICLPYFLSQAKELSFITDACVAFTNYYVQT